MDVPSTGQLALVFAAILIFAAGGVASLLRLRADRRQPPERRPRSYRVIAKSALYLGTLVTIAVLVWHCVARGNLQPLEDNFGAFLSLAILLALFVLYTQCAHPLRGLDVFIMPIIMMLLVLAAVFGKTLPHEYRDTTWSVVHVLSASGGFVAFAVAGAVGGMYLFANRRLRNKKMMPNPGFGSLERLEHLTFVSVTLGFALLTLLLITGFFRVLRPDKNAVPGPEWYRNPKVVLACAAWVVYALVLHSPINPSFRGRRTAMLSVLGFVIMIGVFVAVQFMPKR